MRVTSPRKNRSRFRPALTLTEMLVAIAIAAVLISLGLLGTMQVLRRAEAARCQNNLRQQGIALQMFHDRWETFPSSGGWRVESSPELGWERPPSGASPDELREVYHDNPTKAPWPVARFGFPDPAKPPKEQLGSWPYQLLPDLDAESVYRERAFSSPVAVFTCPARRAATPQVCPPTDPVDPKTVYLYGDRNPWSKSDYNANGLVIQCYPHPMTNLSEITNGLSNTILVGEKALSTDRYTTGGWYWDEPLFVGCNVRTGTRIVADAPGSPIENLWGSPHPGGAYFLFADGSVRLLGFDISSTEMMQLLLPHSGDFGGVKRNY